MASLSTKMVRSFVVILHTQENRGDHSADVSRVVNVDPHVTVDEMVRMMWPDDSRFIPLGGTLHVDTPEYDWIEIKPVVTYAHGGGNDD